MLSQTAEYALRAVVHLAANPDEPKVTRAIAEATRVPAGYLSKVLQGLVRTNLVRSQRGLGGGFKLARPAKQISVLDVLAATDNPLQRITECPIGVEAHKRLCPVHRFVDEAIAELERRFSTVSIAELLSGTDGAAPLCQAPCGVSQSIRRRKRQPAAKAKPARRRKPARPARR